MGLIDGFELKEGTGWQAAIQAAPAVLAGVQAIQAQINYGKRMTDIKNFRRQDLENPFANMSNPYENLAVATKAAEIQMEQTDQALANTLDTLRETGAAAGGATAIANAALKSKQGVAASIEKQEVDNQRLQAQGQQQINFAKNKSQLRIMQAQENREIAGLDRLQGQADISMATRNQSINTGIAASMGAVLLGAGTKGKRASLRFSRTMIHQSSGGSVGNIQDARIDFQEWEKVNNILFELLGKYCGKTTKQVIKDATRDNWFSSSEALKYGIIDEVVTTRK